MASSPKTRFAEFLSAKGRRFTTRMASVVDFALSKDGILTHDDVVTEMRGMVSRATVYRTLAHMVDADVLRQAQFNGCEVLVAAAIED